MKSTNNLELIFIFNSHSISSSHSENVNEMLRTVEKHLRDNSTVSSLAVTINCLLIINRFIFQLNKFDSGQSQIQEKLKAGKYESELDVLVDIKKAIITFFHGKKSGKF